MHLLDDAERSVDDAIEAEPADLVGHWYMIATSLRARRSRPRERWAQFIVGEAGRGGQISLLQSQKFGRDLRYAGRLTQEFCGSGFFSWRGVLWRLPLPRSHWRMTSTRDGDLLCLRHSGSIAMQAVTIVFARDNVPGAPAREKLVRGVRQLGMSTRELRDLNPSPRPPAHAFEEMRERWQALTER